MKAAILYGDREIRMGTAPDPSIRADEVLVRSDAAGICGTDVHIYRGEFHDRVKYPAIQGHEFGGVIEEVGRDVKAWKPGDRVAVDPIIPCHGCPACHEGHINACRTLRLLGVDMDGGFGQYVAVPQNSLFALPDSVPMKHASMVEMYGLGHHVLARAGCSRARPWSFSAQASSACRCSTCCVTGRTRARPWSPTCSRSGWRPRASWAPSTRSTSRARTRCSACWSSPAGVGADCVIECVGHYHEAAGLRAPLADAVKMIRNGGRVVTAGLGEQLSPVHFKTLVMKEATIVATRVTAGEFPRAIRLMSKGLLHPELLITHEVPMSEVTQAFATVDRDEPSTIKVVLDVQEI